MLSAKNRTGCGIVINCVLALFIVLIALGLLLPAVRHAGPAARRASCSNNLQQILLALHNYADTYGVLPPAYTVDANGNRLHSWRTLILPFIEQGDLYDSIDLSLPWDHPVNAEARRTVINVYRCPSVSYGDNGTKANELKTSKTKTTYLAVTGPGFAFTGKESQEFSSSSGRLTVVDAPTGAAVEWMSPHDIPATTLRLLAGLPEALQEQERQHPGVMHGAMLDGSVHSLGAEDLRKLLAPTAQPQQSSSQ